MVVGHTTPPLKWVGRDSGPHHTSVAENVVLSSVDPKKVAPYEGKGDIIPRPNRSNTPMAGDLGNLSLKNAVVGPSGFEQEVHAIICVNV